MIILHLGLHKTGSSAIQHHLAAQGLASPAAWTQALKAGRLDPSWIAAARRRSNRRTVVLSEEATLGSMWNVYAEAPDRATRIGQAFEGSIDRVIVYVRPQIDWLESVYAQRLQRGETLHPDAFLAEMIDAPFLEWDRLVAPLITAFGHARLDVRAYPGRSGVVADFCSAANLPNAQQPTEPRTNVSIPAPRLAILRALNERDGSAHWRPRRWLLQGTIPRTRREAATSVFSDRVQRQIIERFEPSWRRLEQGSRHALALRHAWTRSTDTRPHDAVGSSLDHPAVQSEMLDLIDACAGRLVRPPRRGTQLRRAILASVRRWARRVTV